MFTQVTDYTTSGQNPLAFTRTYNSLATPDTLAISTGRNWRHNYDRYLRIYSQGIVAERPDGQFISFTSSSGVYTPDSDVDYKLTKSGTTWTLTDPDDTKETYTEASGKGTLKSIKLRNTYTQAIGYSSGQISYVSDSYSRTLGFNYSSAGLLTSVTTPDSLVLTYGYVNYASANRLTTVSYNTSPTTSQTYLYENASYPYALTGITDENGARYATWTYDDTGLATSSKLGTGADYTQISYDSATGNRTVTGPLGIQDTYSFTTLQGVPKVSQISRAANGTVAAATRSFTYDANGYLATETDWNGNITNYTNNSHGDPTRIVYASTTPNAQTIDITYDGTWAQLARTVNQKGLNLTNTYDSTNGTLLFVSATDMTTQTVPYYTNNTTRRWAFTYTSTGQLKTAQLPRTDVTAKTTFGYSSSGGVLTSVTNALSQTTTAVTYKSGGLPLTVTDPNSVLTTYAYNPRNWLTSSVLTVSGGSLTTTLAYDSAGNLTRSTLPDGSYLDYGYDTAHRPTSITNRLNESQAITYNSASNITQVLWKNASAVTKRQQTATYDALGRMLTDVGGMSQTTAYTYDKNGNVLTVTDPLGNISFQSSDQLNRPYRFKDAAGYISTITYDSASRPLTVTDPKGNVTSYVYNGFGDLIQQTSPDTLTTIWFYDPDSNVTGMNQAGINFSSATYDALDRILTRTYPADSSLNGIRPAGAALRVDG